MRTRILTGVLAAMLSLGVVACEADDTTGDPGLDPGVGDDGGFDDGGGGLDDGGLDG